MALKTATAEYREKTAITEFLGNPLIAALPDGIPQKDLSAIGYERRNGYLWVGDGPKRVIERYKKLNY